MTESGKLEQLARASSTKTATPAGPASRGREPRSASRRAASASPASTSTAGSQVSAAPMNAPRAPRPCRGLRSRGPSAVATPGDGEQPAPPRPAPPSPWRAKATRPRDGAVASTCSVRPSCSSLGPAAAARGGAKQVTSTASDGEDGRQQGVLRRADAAQALDHLSSRRLGVAAGRPTLGADRAIGQPERRPAPAVQDHERRPVHPPGQHRAASASRGEPSRRAGPGGEHARPEVAAPCSGVRRDEQRRPPSAQEQQQQPPPRLATRRAAGYQPNGLSQESHPVPDVADGPERVDAPIAGRGDAGTGPRLLAESWQATAVRPIEDPRRSRPRPAPSAIEPRRAGGRPRRRPAAASTPDDQRDQHRLHDRGGQRRSRPTAVPREQLVAAALLLGAGVPADQRP